MVTSRFMRRGVMFAASALPLALVASSSHAASLCRDVEGHYIEHDASGSGCSSPVGLCIAGEYFGDVKGSFFGAATTISPTADTPNTAVLSFTSASTITARVAHRSGTLIIRNAGVFRTAGTGSIVDLQTIVGGTGGLAGASGDLRASGVFSLATGGRSSYTGTVCLPTN
jgi:hypothetical protein